MDDAVSGILLISFGSNLYFVCLQLLKSINVNVHFSLTLKIGRSAAVLRFASVPEPVRQLRLVPAEGYHEVVPRLVSELSTDTVALGGLWCFSFTRKLFLAVDGNIVTNKLVLIQFDEDTSRPQVQQVRSTADALAD